MLVGPVPGVVSPPSPAAPASEGAEAGDAPARVLVLPALVSGGLPPSTGAEIRTIVSDELAAEGIAVLPADASPAQCDAACRSAAAQAAGANFVAQAQVVGDEDEFTVTVTLYGADGQEIARGLVAYDSTDAQRIKGRKSSEIEKELGLAGRDELIHRDDLVMMTGTADGQ